MGDCRRCETLCGDQVHTTRLACGVTLIVIAKPGFVRSHASFAARYGSFDRAFRLPGRAARETPDGIAHFLEHTLFEGRGGNALEMFSRRGALINAGTSYRCTSYHFTAVTDFAPQLAMLLEFVRAPHFTDASVAKERGIIGQEIRMYDDMPDDVRQRLLMGALFARHPIGTHIAGTRASIERITPDLLYECFDAFYRPENMVLIAAGDLDCDAVRALAEDTLSTAPEWRLRAGAPVSVFEEETAGAAERVVSRRMPVGFPKIAVGYKETRGDDAGSALLARESESDFLCEMAFGRASALFARLYEDGIIDESFRAHSGVFPRIGYVAVAADTPRPADFIAAVRDAGARAADGLTEEDFARVRRKFEGELIRLCNSPEMLAGMSLATWVDGATVADAWEALHRVTLDDVRGRARAVFAPEGCAVAAVLPLAWEGELGA